MSRKNNRKQYQYVTTAAQLGQPQQPQWPQQPPPWPQQQPQPQWQNTSPPSNQPQWQGQQWNQQPGQYQPSPMMPPSQPPKKKSRKGLWIGILVLAVVICGTIVNATSHNTNPTTTTTIQTTNNTPAPTTKPTQAKSLKWTTVQTFSGNGIKKTAVFAVPSDWKLVWNCTGQNIGGVTADGALDTIVYNSDNTLVDAAINATCKAGSTKTTGETEEHQSGNIYLSVNATGDWSIQVQELR